MYVSAYVEKNSQLLTILHIFSMVKYVRYEYVFKNDTKERGNTLANNVFGIDLGTYNIRIYSGHNESVIIEKNMIAIENKVNLFAFGDSAFEMYEKAPANIQTSFPLTNGVIADIKNMQLLIRNFIEIASKNNYKNSDFYISVPTDITEVEKRAFYDLIKESKLKARNIYMVEKAVADGVGLGVDVKSSQGMMVVDVGYNTTEISVISLGGIVLSKLIKTGGFKFDDVIRNTVRREYSLVIGAKSAEKLKISLAELKKKNEPAYVYGRDIVSGLPMEREVSISLIEESLKEHFKMIVDNVKQILERTPPELAADIYRNGLFLTGGGSLVSDFGISLANGTGLKVNLAPDAIESVIQGIAEISKNDKFKSVVYTIDRMEG